MITSLDLWTHEILRVLEKRIAKANCILRATKRAGEHRQWHFLTVCRRDLWDVPQSLDVLDLQEASTRTPRVRIYNSSQYITASLKPRSDALLPACYVFSRQGKWKLDLLKNSSLVRIARSYEVHSSCRSKGLRITQPKSIFKIDFNPHFPSNAYEQQSLETIKSGHLPKTSSAFLL